MHLTVRREGMTKIRGGPLEVIQQFVVGQAMTPGRRRERPSVPNGVVPPRTERADQQPFESIGVPRGVKRPEPDVVTGNVDATDDVVTGVERATDGRPLPTYSA